MKENNVVVIPAAIPKDKKLDKYGGWEWMEISIKSWKYWCEKNGYQFEGLMKRYYLKDGKLLDTISYAKIK